MTAEFFKEQIQRLKSRFGEKAFDREFCDLIAAKVKFMSDESFVSLVNFIIGSRKPNDPPLIEDFAKPAGDARRERKLYMLGEHKPLSEANCADCLDSGFIRLARKESHEPWALWRIASAPCHCARGRELIEADKRAPEKRRVGFTGQFNDRWRKSYDVIAPPRAAVVRLPGQPDDGGVA